MSAVTGHGARGRTKVWAWGSTGEEKWNADLEISTDWKSLVRSGKWLCILNYMHSIFRSSAHYDRFLSRRRVD